MTAISARGISVTAPTPRSRPGQGHRQCPPPWIAAGPTPGIRPPPPTRQTPGPASSPSAGSSSGSRTTMPARTASWRFARAAARKQRPREGRHLPSAEHPPRRDDLSGKRLFSATAQVPPAMPIGGTPEIPRRPGSPVKPGETPARRHSTESRPVADRYPRLQGEDGWVIRSRVAATPTLRAIGPESRGFRTYDPRGLAQAPIHAEGCRRVRGRHKAPFSTRNRRWPPPADSLGGYRFRDRRTGRHGPGAIRAAVEGAGRGPITSAGCKR